MIVPHYDDLRRLGTCLDALAPQLAAAPRVECVVVDNDSPCDLAPLKATHSGIRFVTETERGAAATRNRGVTETTAPAIVFLDSDCVPAAAWLTTALALADGLGRDGAPDILGGRIETFDETPPPRSGAEAFETVFAFDQRGYIAAKGFSVTANLLTTRAVFEDTGPLAPAVSEDVDWCHRATARGHRLGYADTLVVAHPTRSDWAALTKKWRRTTREMFLLGGTGPAARARWALRAVAVAASGPAHVPRIARARGLSGRDRLAGAGMLVRLRLARAGWMLRQALTPAGR